MYRVTGLQGNDKVDFVWYPGLADTPHHQLTKKYLQNGIGGSLQFGIKGGVSLAAYHF